jgi:molybdopterin molybdotransferase
MLELEEALARILAQMPTPVRETVPLREARGRVALDPVPAPIDLPPFSNSSMDGYAVRFVDVAAAQPCSPVRLRLTGRIPAGEAEAGKVNPGSCLRVFTGSPIPCGADAVVMQEDTRIEPHQADEILVLDPVGPGENVRAAGEDVKRGTLLVNPGDRLTVGRIALLAAAGLDQMEVGRRPRVGVLATGSELRYPGQLLGPGQIYDSNRTSLTALLELAGAAVLPYPLVPDTLSSTTAALRRALEECDLVLTCGGVSVGEMDWVKAAFEQVGGRLEFWKVAIKPGKPFVFGRYGSRHFFGLPGNPVSALVTFLLLVRPALLRWQGATTLAMPASVGVLGEPIENAGSRRHFVRVSIDPSGTVWSSGAQASHTLSSFARADGLVDVAAGTTLAAGSQVRVLHWE